VVAIYANDLGLFTTYVMNPLDFADESPFLLIKFHPEGEPEAFMAYAD
jgi:hypothetical protein